MIITIFIMSFALLISMTFNFILADITNKLDLTNEDLMEENEVLREKMRRNCDICLADSDEDRKCGWK